MSNIFWNRNIPDECHQKMGSFASAGHNLMWVAFPPAGGNSWSVITDKTFFNRNIPQECHDKMKAFVDDGHKLRLVAFPKQGGNRWSIVGQNVFFNRNVPDECHMILGEIYAGHGPVRCLAFDADGNGWSVASAAKPVVVYSLPFGLDGGGWQVIGGHGSEQQFAIDFAHKDDATGREIRAARAGVVATFRNDLTENTSKWTDADWAKIPAADQPAVGAGSHVLIRHSDNSVAAYAHLKPGQSFVTQIGQPVVLGQVIGLADNTGQSFGPHLHFDVRTFWNTAQDLGPTIQVRFHAKDHIFWTPKVGDSLLSDNG